MIGLEENENLLKWITVNDMGKELTKFLTRGRVNFKTKEKCYESWAGDETRLACFQRKTLKC